MAFRHKRSLIDFEVFRQIALIIFFLLYFLYFLILNRFILLFQEQSQLFRLSKSYFSEFLQRPGGISEYAGEFLTQFFLFPVTGPIILTLIAIILFIITAYILGKHGIKGIFYSLVPVLLLAGLHSNYLYKISYSIGLILSLGHFALHISLKNTVLRYLNLFFGWLLLYYISGGYAYVSVIMCLIHGLFAEKGRIRFITTILIIFLSVMTPYISSRFIFYIPNDKAVSCFIPFFINPPARYILIILLLYLPLALMSEKLLSGLLKSPAGNVSHEHGLKKNLAGIITISILSALLFLSVYDRKTELLLGMDHFIQRSGWKNVLDLSKSYPDTNRLVMYFTNLSLYKTGQLADHMFEYPQAGSKGLWLDWKRDGATAFFGCELFYELGYINEAYRWAFEAMVAKGPNPRSLKLLAATSLINDDLALAGKYLRILNQSLFYRKWAQRYRNMLSDPFLLERDPGLSRNRMLLTHTDFFAGNNNLNLRDLLINHPENRMAYDYFMASLLLDRNLKGFSEMISNLHNYGYTRLPVHYEEALIFLSSFEKQNFIPEGFVLSQETVKRFRDFAETYVRHSDKPALMEKELRRKHGTTFWYYLHNDRSDYLKNEQKD